MNQTSGRAELEPRIDAQPKPNASATRCHEKNSQIPGRALRKKGLKADAETPSTMARYPVAWNAAVATSTIAAIPARTLGTFVSIIDPRAPNVRVDAAARIKAPSAAPGNYTRPRLLLSANPQCSKSFNSAPGKACRDSVVCYIFKMPFRVEAAILV